jgi:hypothetical protein
MKQEFVVFGLDTTSTCLSRRHCSWNDVLDEMLKPRPGQYINNQRHCSDCYLDHQQIEPTNSGTLTITKTIRIQQLNDSVTLSLDRNSWMYRDLPLVILPILNLIPYCEPSLLDKLSVEGKPKCFKNLSDSLSNTIPVVIIKMIVDYTFQPAQYSLQSILVKDDESGCSSTIVRKYNNNKDQWFFTSDIFDQHCRRSRRRQPSFVSTCHEDIFVTDVTSVPRKSKFQSPLTHATVLRYELTF